MAKKKKESQLERLKRNIKMILKGPKYKTPATKRHLAAKKPPGVPETQRIQKTQKAREYTFVRTKAISKQASKALTQAEIRKLRGKK